MLALVVRIELMTPGKTIVDPDVYNQLFTLHAALMIFLFIIPGIPAALGNLVLPLMLGAKDVAFPRLNLASWWLWVIGALFAVSSIILGSVDTGWTFYTPYSTTTSTAVVTLVTGAFILGFSSIFTGLNFIVTIHKLRPKGMTWFKMPLFLWGLYGTAIMQVLATPVSGDHAPVADRGTGAGRRHLRSGSGRRPGVVPALLLVLFPPGGLHHDLAGDGCDQRTDFGLQPQTHLRLQVHRLQQHRDCDSQLPGLGAPHVYQHVASGQHDAVQRADFQCLDPSAIKIFNWLATMYKGAIDLKTPMLYALCIHRAVRSAG